MSVEVEPVGLRGGYSGNDIEIDMAAQAPAIMRAKTLFMAQIPLLVCEMA